MTAHLDLHASAVVVGETCVVIRGLSGAGKSALALALIDEAQIFGRYGALVADDRVILEAAHGRLIARGVQGFEGLIENRGEGIVRRQHEPAAVVGLFVDLPARGTAAIRYPEERAESLEILNLTLPLLAVDLALGVTFAARLTLRRLGIAPTECPVIGNFA